MSLSKQELKEIFLKDDILPLGDFEALPVTHAGTGTDMGYPDVCIIQDTGIDYQALLEEAYKHIEIIGNVYVRDRINNINKEVDESTLRDILGSVGFFKGSYQSYSLRKYGTAELNDWILPKTRALFESLPVKTFRQQYAVAFPGWNIKLHRDHGDFKTHGFRAMVPLSADVFMGYEDAHGNPLVYQLKRGGMYFVNIAKMHRGFNESTTKDRVNLIFQMDSDALVIGATPMKPMETSDLNRFPEYALKYEAWDFGYEL